MSENIPMKDWKQLLKHLKLEYIRKTAPSFFAASGGYSMKVKPYTDTTANGLATCIQDYVKHMGGYSNRINTTGMMRKINNEMKWTKGNSNKGAADLRLLHQGVSVDIEIKIGKDRISEAQAKEIERIRQAGGRAFVVHSFPEFLQQWQEVGFDIPELLTNDL